MSESINESITEDSNTISGKFIMTIISGKITYILFILWGLCIFFISIYCILYCAYFIPIYYILYCAYFIPIYCILCCAYFIPIYCILNQT